MDLLSSAARSTRSRGRLSTAFIPAGDSVRPHGCGESAAAVFPETAAASSFDDAGREAFADGFFHAVIIGCVAILIVVLGTGCQRPAATSPGLEAAGANAATLDGTLDTIGYHAAEARKALKQ